MKSLGYFFLRTIIHHDWALKQADLEHYGISDIFKKR
jgi:hypothetical protein